MKIDLAGMVRRVGINRRPYVVGRAIIPTSAQEKDLLRIYMRVVRGWYTEWTDRIRPQYERSLRTLPAIGDSVDDVRGATDAAAEAMNRLVFALGAEIEDWAVRVEQWHRGQFATVFTPAGVNLKTLLGAGDVKTPLQAVLADNVSLIRSLNDQMRNGISGAVFRGLTSRTPAREVAREIRKATGIGTSRAQLIAADQLRKLTARLDQERQEQCGISKFRWLHSEKKYPRPEHVARNGKVYEWNKGVGLSDPPGRAIRCGCRAQPVLELESGAGLEAEQVPESPAPTPAAPAEPAKPRTGFRSPINPKVTAETIEVRPRLALQKEMRAAFAENARDPRYGRLEFRDRRAADVGNAIFSAAFDDQAVSMIAALMPELDDLAAQLGLPKLRGLKTIGGNSVANMGDGVMGLNPSSFNRYALKVGGQATVDKAAEIEAKRAALAEEMRPIVDRVKEIRAQLENARYGTAEYNALWAEQEPLLKQLAKLRDKDNALWRKLGGLEKGDTIKGTSTWKPGDGAKTRPYSSGAYFDNGVDQARTTLFHEFGHHVHQYLKKEGPRQQFGRPPLERDLQSYFRRDMHAGADRVLSKYGTTNEHEWFAENFAAYVMGRRDLVGPAALELIEAIFNGTY